MRTLRSHHTRLLLGLATCLVVITSALVAYAVNRGPSTPPPRVDAAPRYEGPQLDSITVREKEQAPPPLPSPVASPTDAKPAAAAAAKPAGASPKAAHFIIRCHRFDGVIPPGGAGSTTCDITPQGVFSAPAQLTCTSQAGACRLEPSSVTLRGTTPVSTRLTVDANDARGAHTVSVDVRTVEFSTSRSVGFTIGDPAMRGRCTPSSLKSPQGGRPTSVCSFTANTGYSGEVRFQSTGSIEAVCSPCSTTMQSGRAVETQITIHAEKAPGTYRVNVQATAPGFPTATTSIEVTITGSASEPTPSP